MSAKLPLPGGERVGVGGSGLSNVTSAVPPPPHPLLLPVGEKETLRPVIVSNADLCIPQRKRELANAAGPLSSRLLRREVVVVATHVPPGLMLWNVRQGFEELALLGLELRHQLDRGDVDLLRIAQKL